MSVEILPAPANLDPPLPQESGNAVPEARVLMGMTDEEFAAHTRARYGDPKERWTSAGFDDADRSTETPVEASTEPASEQGEWNPDPEVERQFEVSAAIQRGDLDAARLIAAGTTGSEHSQLMTQVNQAEWRNRLSEPAPAPASTPAEAGHHQKGIAQAIGQGMFSKARELAKGAGSERDNLLEQIDRAEEQARLEDEVLRKTVPEEAPPQAPDVTSNDVTAELYTRQELETYAAAQTPEEPAEVAEGLEAMAELDQELSEDDGDAGLDLFGFGPRPPRQPKARAEAVQKAEYSVDLSAKARAAWRNGRKAWEAARGKVAGAAAASLKFAGHVGEEVIKGGEFGAKVFRELVGKILGSAAVEQASEQSQPTYSEAQEWAAKGVYLEILATIHEGQRINKPDLVSRALNAAHVLAVKTHQYDSLSYAKYDEILQLALKEYPGEHQAFMYRTAHFRNALMTNNIALQNQILHDAVVISRRTGLGHEVQTFLLWRNQRYARR